MPTDSEHLEALQTLARALRNPTQMQQAQQNPVLKPILDKLSPEDLQTLGDIAQSAHTAGISVCPP